MKIRCKFNPASFDIEILSWTVITQDLNFTVGPGSLVPDSCIPGLIQWHVQIVRLVGLDPVGFGQDVFVSLQDQLRLLQIGDGVSHVRNRVLDAARQVIKGTVDISWLFFHDQDVFVQTLLFAFEFVDAEFFSLAMKSLLRFNSWVKL